MIKKMYMQPALEIMQAEVEEIVAVSVTGVQTSGLDDDDLIVPSGEGQPKNKDIWDNAW